MDIELNNRKIRYSDEKDILIWGYTSWGIVSTKEAYGLMIQTQEPVDPIWERM